MGLDQKLVLKRFKASPKETVYADDQEVNLKDAKEIGVNTILVKNFSQLKRDLNRIINLQ